MRRHHENRMKFDFPRDGKQNQFAFLTKTIPSRSNRKRSRSPPLFITKVSCITGGVERGEGNVLVPAEITLVVIAPENLAKLNSPMGTCWRSRNQEVPCESLVPFFSQERNCQCGRHEPTKAKTFLKLWFETDCRYSILASALKQHFCKKRNFPCGLVPCAETEILQHTIARNRVQVQPTILPASPLGPMVRA